MPVDLRAGVTAELEPVFAALSETMAECERLRTGSATEAERCLDAAHKQAAAMLAQADGAAQAERATVAARMRERAATDLAATEEESRAAADEIARRAAAQLPGLVNEVVERVRRDIAALGPDVGAPAGSAP
jgi:hypothetical protein